MLSALLCVMLVGRTPAESEADYAAYAKRCHEFTVKTVAHVQNTRKKKLKELSDAGRGIIVPGSSDGGDHWRSFSPHRMVFESKEEKREFVAALKKEVREIDDSLAKTRQGDRYLAAPLPLPPEPGQMGLCEQNFEVVQVIDHSSAILRMGEDAYLFKGECRDMVRGYVLPLTDLLYATGRIKQELPSGKRQEMVILETADRIALRPHLFQEFPEWDDKPRKDKHDIGARPNAK